MNETQPTSPGQIDDPSAAVRGGFRSARKRARSSIYAQGEPMVWLTGGALIVAVIMIIGLLLLVFSFGLSTFWPTPVTKVVTTDGQVYMGEITRTDSYRPEADYVDRLPEAARAEARRYLEKHDGNVVRRLFRTGNYRITQRHFHWVDETVVQEESRPDWALLLERLEWGRFIGFPEAFVRIHYIPNTDADGNSRSREAIQKDAFSQIEAQKEAHSDVRLLAQAWVEGRQEETLLPADQADSAAEILGIAIMTDGPGAAWRLFQKHHRGVRQVWQKRKRLEKHEVGHVNDQEEAARLAQRAATMKVEDARARDGEASDAYRQAVREFDRAARALEEKKAWAAVEFARLRDEIKAINQENGRYRMWMRTSGEASQPARHVLIRLDDVVRALPPNQLDLAGKARVYFSRWGEFLKDDPREANAEGGVFPAIFGTVAMTFIMIIVVVPFGVLAALYLREYAKAGPIVSAVRIAVNNLAGVPSIVFGVFGLGFFCYGVGSFVDGGSTGGWTLSQWLVLLAVWVTGLFAGLVLWKTGFKNITARSSRQLRYVKGVYLTLWCGALLVGAFVLVAQMPFFDGLYRANLPNPTFGKGGILWAALTLALLTLPVVIVATEESLSAVPNSLREGSYACGASKWQTIKRIVLPRAMPGIMTGMVLAMARGAGEVAPLMLVGAVKLAPELPVDGLFPFLHMERSFMHLGFHIYDVGFQSQNSEAAKPMVYTTTMLLIVLVVVMNLVAIYLRNRLRQEIHGTGILTLLSPREGHRPWHC